MNSAQQFLNSIHLRVGLPHVCWIILLSFVVAAYWPGLSGPFILDDFGSIAALGHRGGVVDWATFKSFVFGGTSGPSGRPISLLTFLVDANNWPAESLPFKRTNLLIHCACGVILGSLVQHILEMLGLSRKDSRWLALASAGIWLLHPFLVSTTLYVVQRMAQLSTLFTLSGLLIYVRGRVILQANSRRAYIMMSTSIVIFSALATFSKENGILLPLLAAVIEVTVVASRPDTLGRLNRYWALVFLLLPAVVVMAYLSSRFFRSDFLEIVPPRDFSIYERALTEPRILIDYLQNWFLPKLYTTGVFQDHFLKSTGLMSPVTTLLAILAHLGIIVVAVIKRRRWPLFALAALFFYGSHLLESTVLNLELYFEHRNYLGSGFLFLPLLVAMHQKVSARQFSAACLAIFLLLGSFTRYSSSVWASWPSMVEASARKAPNSERAQAQYSVLLFNAGRYVESLRVLEQAIETIPGPNQLLRVNRLISLCQLDRLSAEEFEREANELSQQPYDARMITVYATLANNVVTGKCPSVAKELLTNLFTGMLQLRFNSKRESLQYSQIQYLIGFSYAHTARPDDAVAAFNESLTARPGASHAMQMAAVLAGNEYGAEALQFSERALAEIANPSASVLDAAPISEADIRTFQETVRAEIKASKETDSAREGL